MPGGDRTGPLGEGPMTGRGAGFCSGYSRPGYGRGFGRGLGRMRFLDRILPVRREPTKEQEKQHLEEEIQSIEAHKNQLAQDLDNLKRRLSEIENK